MCEIAHRRLSHLGVVVNASQVAEGERSSLKSTPAVKQVAIVLTHPQWRQFSFERHESLSFFT